jgi:hypothetical protein
VTQGPSEARAHLEALRAELDERGWPAKHFTDRVPELLHVRNPAVPGLADLVMVRDQDYVWGWGRRIVPVTQVTKAVDEIQHILRAPSSG